MQKIAVVNDDITQLSILTGLLNREGFETVSFSGVEEALNRLVSRKAPDLIVTDLYMPGIDGWRFCRLLRSPEYAAFNETPILIVSATFSGDDPERIARELGAGAFLPMPVDGTKFIRTVRGLLRGDAPKHAMRALIVENNPEFAEILCEAFTKHGYLADIALTKKEAVDKFTLNTPDIVVLTYNLPDFESDDLLTHFQQTGSNAVLIMTTADRSPGLALSWIKGGAAAHVNKPFDPEYLLELCARAHREKSLLRVEAVLEERTRRLRKSEAELKAVYEYNPVMMCIFDRNMRVVDTNRAFRDMLGEPKTERDLHHVCGAIGCVHASDPVQGGDYGPPCRACSLRLSLEDTILTGTPYYDIDYRGTVQRHGLQQHVILLGSTIRVAQGDRSRNLLCLVDIAERIRTAEALRESEARFRNLMEYIPKVSIQGYRTDGTVLYWNRASEEVYGYKEDEAIGKNLADLIIPPELHPVFDQCLSSGAASTESGELFPAGELILRRKDGSAVPVYSIHTVVCIEGKEPMLFCIDMDLSEQKRMEEKLSQERKL